MKTLLLVLLSSAAFASGKSFSCVGDFSQYAKQGYSPGDIQKLEVRGAFGSNGLENVTAVSVATTYEDKTEVVVGNGSLKKDPNYKPVKFKSHDRYDLTKLKDVKTKNQYYPSNDCEIVLLVPQDAAGRTSFPAPVQVHCEQSGGVTTLKCSTK